MSQGAGTGRDRQASGRKSVGEHRTKRISTRAKSNTRHTQAVGEAAAVGSDWLGRHEKNVPLHRSVELGKRRNVGRLAIDTTQDMDAKREVAHERA